MARISSKTNDNRNAHGTHTQTPKKNTNHQKHSDPTADTTTLSQVGIVSINNKQQNPFHGPCQDYPGEPVPERYNQSGLY